MEIVYLYIHDYRRFKKQNINFGSEYIFHYDNKTNELNVENNHLYIDKFYNQKGHDNILNISAIIGENGTGKTSVIEYLINHVLYDNNKLNDNDIVVLKDNNRYNLISFKNIIVNNDIFLKRVLIKDEVLSSIFSIYNYQTIFLSNIFNGSNLFSGTNKKLPIFNVSTDYLLRDGSEFRHNYNFDLLDHFNLSEVKRQLNFLMDERNKRHFIFHFEKEIVISVKDIDHNFFTKNNINTEFQFFYEKLLSKSLHKNDKDFEIEYLKVIFLLSIFDRNINYLFKNDNFFKNFNNNNKDVFTLFMSNSNTFFDRIAQKGYKFILGKENITIDDLKLLKEFLFEEYKNLIYILIPNDYKKNINNLFSLNLIKFINNNIEILDVNIDAFSFKVNFKNFITFDKLYQESGIGFDFFTYNYEGISSGQRAFLNIFSRLYQLIYLQKNSAQTVTLLNKKKDIILIMDEGDLYLHPMWQKGLITHMIKFLNEIFRNHKIQIIFTSNNPLPISDLLSYNTIFLSNNDCSNETIVKDSLEDQKQTFAANIHTLLADSFFVKGGLIGDFSKDKINEIINLISTNKDLNYEDHVYIKKVIKQIGEPLIKNKLLQMYTQNNGLDFLERLERVEKKLGFND